MAELKVWDTDKTIYLFTSLTAGSSHIITATSRIETILRANKIPFEGVDTATNESAKKLFQRRASGKKLPFLVKEGYVLGGIEEIEEWNEYDEIREALGVTNTFTPLNAKPYASPAASSPSPSTTTTSAATTAKKENVAPSPQQNLAIRQLGAEAAKAAAAKKQAPTKISTTNPLLTEKTNTPTSATPAKSPASAILSPRSVPLPQTPTSATTKKPDDKAKGAIPNLANLQKPIHAPPSMHADAADPALNAGPVSETQKGKAEAEEESSEDDDSEDEEDEDDDDAEESSEGESSEEEEAEVKDSETKPPANTQAQDPKDASAAGQSVKEGEQDAASPPEDDDDDDDDEEESSEDDSPTEAKPSAAAEPAEPTPADSKSKSTTDKAKVAGKTKASDKKTSANRKVTLADKLAAANKKKLAEKKKLADEKKVAEKKKAAERKKAVEKKTADKKKTTTTTSSSKKTTSAKKDADKKADGKGKEKTQDQGAADAGKAGESVED